MRGISETHFTGIFRFQSHLSYSKLCRLSAMSFWLDDVDHENVSPAYDVYYIESVLISYELTAGH